MTGSPVGAEADALTLVAGVIAALGSSGEVEPDDILLVGAECRNVLHARAGFPDRLRATEDLDLGIAVPQLGVFERIRERFPLSGTNGLQVRVEGIPVDVLPFGAVASPGGDVLLPTRSETISVFGFAEVWAAASALELPGGTQIRLPTEAGYAALKLRAWLDRSEYGQYKDAVDIGTVLLWYLDGARAERRRFEEDNLVLLERAGWDVEIAAVRLLGRDIAEVLGERATADLALRWGQADHARFAARLAFPAASGRGRPSPDAAMAWAAALGEELSRG